MFDDPKKIVGLNIRRLRKQAGWSQEELAEAAELHRTYIGAIERGERNVSLENIVGIARAFGVRPSVLLEGIS
jgi:transcriptional regulator with XRE-family HTH domain